MMCLRTSQGGEIQMGVVIYPGVSGSVKITQSPTKLKSMIPGATRTRGSTIYYVRDYYSTPLGSIQTVKQPVTVCWSSRGMSFCFYQVGKQIHELIPLSRWVPAGNEQQKRMPWINVPNVQNFTGQMRHLL
jgi:hypothetical protein